MGKQSKEGVSGCWSGEIPQFYFLGMGRSGSAKFRGTGGCRRKITITSSGWRIAIPYWLAVSSVLVKRIASSSQSGEAE